MNEKRLSILLVEGNGNHVEAIRGAFRKKANHISLAIARDLQSARNTLAKALPDLVLAADRLADGAGTELLISAKGQPLFPVVVLVDCDDKCAMNEILKLGALDCIASSRATLAAIPHLIDCWLRSWSNLLGRRRLEAQLRLVRQLQTIPQEAGRAAHDLNNILTVIGLYAELSLRNGDMPADHEERMRIIMNQSVEGTNQVRQLLQFLQQAVFDRVASDLEPHLRDWATLLYRTLPPNVTFELDVAADDCTIKADLVQLQHALMILTVNALGAMPEGGSFRIGLDRLHVGREGNAPLEGMTGGDWLCLTASDSGTGAPAAELEDGDDMERNALESCEGRSLGLTQVYSIVKSHHGHMDVRNEPGLGTRVRIFLPAYSLNSA